VPFSLDHPWWIEDPNFDLSFHIRALSLAKPGYADQLAEQVARIHGRPMDRSRPLWEVYVIDGLGQDRWALLTKYHHATIDGASGVMMLTMMNDLSPDVTVHSNVTCRTGPVAASRLTSLEVSVSLAPGPRVVPVLAEPQELLRVACRQMAHPLVVPVAEALLVPACVDLRANAELVGDRRTGLDGALQARGDDARRAVADERPDSGHGGPGLAPALDVQRGVRSSSPVQLARGGEVGDAMTHQHDPRRHPHVGRRLGPLRQHCAMRAPQMPDSEVRIRIRRHSSQRSTSSGAAAVSRLMSTWLSSRRQPSQRR